MTTIESGVSSMVLVGEHRHPTLAAALAAFQAEVPKMSKDETAKVTGEGKNGPVKYTYGYAGLDQFVEIVEPVLGKHGLSVTGTTTWANGHFLAVISLLHEGGEERTACWPLPDPFGRGVGPQDIGSMLTYIRRYLGWLLTGTFPGGVDDDGKQAQATARERWEDAQPAQRPVDDRQAQAGQEPQAAPAPAAPKTSWTDEEVLKMLVPMPKAGDLAQAIRVYDWMAGKDLHNRKVPMDFQGTPVPVTATDLVAGRIADEAMGATLETIKAVQTLASNRGLMKVKVSESETLAEALFSAQELAKYAAAEAGPVESASDLRQDEGTNFHQGGV